MKMHKSITLERVMEMAQRDRDGGICTACGKDAHGVEPDARRYECEECGEDQVYGAEELMVMLAF